MMSLDQAPGKSVRWLPFSVSSGINVTEPKSSYLVLSPFLREMKSYHLIHFINLFIYLVSFIFIYVWRFWGGGWFCFFFYMLVQIYARVHGNQKRVIRSPGAGILSGWEPPSMGAGN